MSDGSRTFRVSFPEDGLVRLRVRLREKLKEFMGDYTDDTLVDYVIVLLRNGRSEAEAGNELKAFLEDDSISFVSWLWDHLSSDLDLYLQPSGAVAERENESDLAVQSWDQTVQSDQVDDALDLDSDNELESPSELSKIRHNREWKGLMQETEPLILRSTVVGSNHITKKSTPRNRSLKRSLSPKPQIHRKRSIQDEQPIAKRVAASRPMLGASSRLLQFAVRDAVKTVQQSFSRPAPKRLRSVVSSSVVDSSGAHLPQGTRLAPRVVGTVATAIKAAAEAAEDVKLKRSLSISDRLHQQSERSVVSVPSSNIKSTLDEVGEDYDQRTKHIDRRSEHGVVAHNMMVDKSNELPYDLGSDYEGDNSVGNLGNLVGEVSENAPKLKESNSLMFQCSVPQNAKDVMRKTLEDQEQSNVSTTKAQKILNISVNVNTWKPPDFQVSRETTEFANQIVSRSNEKDADNFRPHIGKGLDNNVFATKNEILQSSISQKEIPKPVPPHGSHSSARPSEDADSRTVFVSNVHFGATKDTLSSHFNKFGEVLKVVIMTDGATGQPTGSAYVEFLRKECAELALSLNGTSFMSRILKVVRRSFTSQEITGMMWPRIARPSSFTPRHARVPFSRVMVSPFRGRLPVKPGARSLQWKRDSPGTPSKEGAKNIQNSQVSSNALTTSFPRNLTYVRNEAKSDASASLA